MVFADFLADGKFLPIISDILWHRSFVIFRDGRSLNSKLFCYCVKTILDFFLVKP